MTEVKEFFTNGLKWIKLVTPATADDGDTIDASSFFKTGCMAEVIGATDGHLLETKISYNTTITIPGSTDNEVRTIYAKGE